MCTFSFIVGKIIPKSVKCIHSAITGLLSNQGEKSINLYFIRVPLRKKSIKVWYSKAQIHSLARSLTGNNRKNIGSSPTSYIMPTRLLRILSLLVLPSSPHKIQSTFELKVVARNFRKQGTISSNAGVQEGIRLCKYC